MLKTAEGLKRNFKLANKLIFLRRRKRSNANRLSGNEWACKLNNFKTEHYSSMVQWKARHKWCLLIQDHKPRLSRGKTSLESIIPEIRGWVRVVTGVRVWVSQKAPITWLKLNFCFAKLMKRSITSRKSIPKLRWTAASKQEEHQRNKSRIKSRL